MMQHSSRSPPLTIGRVSLKDILKIVVVASSMMARAYSMTTKIPSKAASANTSTQQRGGDRSLFVHWFRSDLRLHDNPALLRTIESASPGGSGILPLFCFDPRVFGSETRSEFGSLKCGPRRARFLLEGVADLRRRLEERGSGLLIAHGRPEDVLRTLLNDIDGGPGKRSTVPRVFCQQEVASEELRVDKAVRSAIGRDHPQSTTFESVWGSTMYEPTDLPFNGGIQSLPDVFTPFRNKVEKKCEIGKPLPVPSAGALALPADQTVRDVINGGGSSRCSSLSYLPTLEDLGYTAEEVEGVRKSDPRGVMEFKGGETAALSRLKDYIWDKDLLKVRGTNRKNEQRAVFFLETQFLF